jgi:4,4'-diaponeurosporenoate glycosyltransferase
MNEWHILCAGAWLVGWVLLARVPRLRPAPQALPGSDRALTVVIPARNEAERLPHLLGDLAASRPVAARVIVVDDHSDDGTAEIAGGFDFVEVLRTPDLEGDWVGKTWACHCGARAAQPGVLVFVDADVRLQENALDRVIAAWPERRGLLTLWPYHRVRRPYEHLSALFNVTALMAIGCGSMVPPRKVRGGFGPFMATSTEDYAAVGGHESVRTSVIDDFALASRYADHDLPVVNLGGGRLVSFRMYPHGIRQLVEGWTKNFGLGAKAVALWRVFGIALWITCSIGCLTWVHGVPNGTGEYLYALFAIQMAVLFRQVGSFSVLDAVLYPLHVVFFTLVFARSLVHTYVLRRVTWRGRRIRTNSRASD